MPAGRVMTRSGASSIERTCTKSGHRAVSCCARTRMRASDARRSWRRPGTQRAAVEGSKKRAVSRQRASGSAQRRQRAAGSAHQRHSSGRTGQTVAGLAGRERPISGVTTRGRAQDLWKASKSSKSGELILQGSKEAVVPLESLSQSSLMHFRRRSGGLTPTFGLTL